MSDLDDLSDLADSRAFSWSGGYKNGMSPAIRRPRPAGSGKCGNGHELTPQTVRTYKVEGGKRWRWKCKRCDQIRKNARGRK